MSRMSPQVHVAQPEDPVHDDRLLGRLHHYGLQHPAAISDWHQLHENE